MSTDVASVKKDRPGLVPTAGGDFVGGLIP